MMSKPELRGLELRVTPNARQNKIEAGEDGSIKVRLQAPPVEGKANEALVKFLAARLGAPRKTIHLMAGAHSRTKTIHVEGYTANTLRAALLASAA